MAFEVFPTSLHFTLGRKIRTGRLMSKSENEYRQRSQKNHRPYYDFEISTVNMTNTQLDTLETFFIAHLFDQTEDAFYLEDPKDNTLTSESVGTGDGSEDTFQLKRKYIQGARSAEFIQQHIQPNSETIYIDGSAVAATDYTIDNETGVVTFDTAPADGASITADFSFYRKCIFTDANIEFSNVRFSASNAIYNFSEVP